MAFTMQNAIAQMGVSSLVRGFVKALTNETKEYEGKHKQQTAIVVAAGTAEIKVGYKPEEIKFDLPPLGAYVEILCDRGDFSGKPFYNRPTSCRVRLNPDGTEAAKA